MVRHLKKLLDIPAFYHYSSNFINRDALKTWANYGNYLKKNERIADLGCGPSDILRFLDPNTKPLFYLGIDMSDRYLKYAHARAIYMGFRLNL
jgi:SAM-dependent methyltransferase